MISESIQKYTRNKRSADTVDGLHNETATDITENVKQEEKRVKQKLPCAVCIINLILI